MLSFGTELQLFLGVLVGQLPAHLPTVIALVLAVVLVARRPVTGSARAPALAGFGLLLLLQLAGMLVWPL